MSTSAPSDYQQQQIRGDVEEGFCKPAGPGFDSRQRRPIPIRPIQKLSCRQVTFSKRKKSLLHKAQQLSGLCNAEVGLIIFSPSGKLFHYASSSCSLDRLLNKYRMCSQTIVDTTIPTTNPPEKINKLEGKESRNTTDNDTQGLSIEHLQQVEKQFEIYIQRVRETKMKIIMDELEEVKQKEFKLGLHNYSLRNKLEEFQASCVSTKDVDKVGVVGTGLQLGHNTPR